MREAVVQSYARKPFHTDGATDAMELESASTALIVIDMQNAFCHPDGSLYAPGSRDVLDPIRELIEQVRTHDVPVVFTRDVHPPEQFEDTHYYDEFDRWGEHVLPGTWGAQLHEELPVEEGDHVVEKHTYDAFDRTELAGYLDARGIKDLMMVGTLANVCVLHTAGSAGLRDFRPILVEEGIGAIESEHKTYALEHAEWLFGEVASTDHISIVPASSSAA